MYFVYFLHSARNGDLYIGSCKDIIVCLRLHNIGKVRSTKHNRPWKLLGSEEYKTRSEAIRRERFLKTGQQRELLKRRFNL